FLKTALKDGPVRPSNQPISDRMHRRCLHPTRDAERPLLVAYRLFSLRRTQITLERLFQIFDSASIEFKILDWNFYNYIESPKTFK
ncbi:hypothetical protein L9F63_000111, partial [Diploptera punctata]